MRHWKRYLAAAVAVLLVLVVVRVVYVVRHRPGLPGQVALTPGPVLITPASPDPSAVPTNLYVVNVGTIIKWTKTDPGELITIRAIQGLVNRDAPRIFILLNHGALHDQDWLSVLSRTYKAQLVDKADSSRHIDDLSWYFREFRSHFTGYVLFDLNGDGPSPNVALSLAGALSAVPIDRNDSSLIQAAKSAGLEQLEDVSHRDYSWLKNSSYWAKFNRNGVFLTQPSSLQEGADLAVARRMPAFWEDVRSDPQMRTMTMMLSDQKPGGIVFGWGYTDAQHQEDTFVSVASRYGQSVMDTPPNLSVYMHYPVRQPLKNPTAPSLPTATDKHYVALLYSDGDNPKVIFNELTMPGNDRYASPLRGTIPIGWTLPPTIYELAGPVVRQIYATATSEDVFLSGPSGFGFAFPSLIPQKKVFATQTEEAMAYLGLHDVLVLDTDGATGFSHAALDPLTALSSVGGVFFTSFNGRNQPRAGTILWSNGKPVLANVTLHRNAGQSAGDVIGRAASALNSLPKDATSPLGYTVIYVDFWSFSMTDLHNLISRLDPNVIVVRPDVLAAMVQANIRH